MTAEETLSDMLSRLGMAAPDVIAVETTNGKIGVDAEGTVDGKRFACDGVFDSLADAQAVLNYWASSKVSPNHDAYPRKQLELSQRYMETRRFQTYGPKS